MNNKKRRYTNNKRPDNGTGGKKVSIRTITDAVTNVVKNSIISGNKNKPFGGKGGRKKKPTADEIKRDKARENLEILENNISKSDGEQMYSNITSTFSSFFYTDDKFITQFEDKEILEYI